MQFTTCNLCGSDETQALYNSSSWREVFGEQFRLVQCKQCGLVYLNPRPDANEIGAYYEEIYPCYKQSIEQEPNVLIRQMRKRNLSRRRNFVERVSGRSGGAILDVGCATGLFLNEMKRAGWQTFGVEPIITAAQYAQREFGLDVFQGYFQDSPYTENSLDVITFWDVIEHTFSPVDELNHAVRLLKPGGSLIINIPNWESFDRRIFDVYWIGLDPPRHLFAFPRKVMERLIEKAGLRVIDWLCPVPSYYSFAISVERWLQHNHASLAPAANRLLNFPGIRLVFEPWFQITNRLKKSGVITVIARKESE